MVSWFLRQLEYSRMNNAYASLVAYDIISSHNLVFPIFVIWGRVNSYEFQMWSGSYFFKHFPSHSGGILVRWLFHNLPLSWISDMITLWLFNIAMENGPFIDGLPIENSDFPWLC